MKNYPDYLKLHIEEQSAPGDVVATQRHESRGLESLDNALHSIGWKLQCCDLDASARHDWSMVLRDGTDHARRLVMSRADESADVLPLERVRPVAEAIGALVDELLETHGAIWQREAELAAGIPVTLREEDRHALAQRLESVLRGGAEAIGCQAAALYLLDDATSYLKLRAAWQLPKSRFWDEPRPLRGSVADLEALVGHAVALEDTSLLPHWKVPEDFPSALCVPVATSSTPLGTLWFFGHQVREFTAEQIHMVEIVAGRLVADLEREVLRRESLKSRRTDQALEALVNCQDELRPRVPPLVDGWQVAGKTCHPAQVASQFHDWFILPDGRIAVAVADAEGNAIEAALTCVMLQVALRSQAVHPHEPRQMLDLLNETLWTHSTGNRFASLFYAVIDPDSGQMVYASAGENRGLVHGDQALQTLTDGNPTLGYDPDHHYRQSRHTLQLGQSLVLFSREEVSTLDEEFRDPDECRVAQLLPQLADATAETQVESIAHLLQVDPKHDSTVLAVRRIF